MKLIKRHERAILQIFKWKVLKLITMLAKSKVNGNLKQQSGSRGRQKKQK